MLLMLEPICLTAPLEMLSSGALSEKSALAAIGTHQNAYSVAPDIRIKALELVEDLAAVLFLVDRASERRAGRESVDEDPTVQPSRAKRRAKSGRFSLRGLSA